MGSGGALPDPEPLERALRFAEGGIHKVHMPSRITRVERIQQALAGGAGPLRDNLHTAIVQVLGVPAQTHRFGGASAPPAEPHPLHPPAHVRGELRLGRFGRGFIGEIAEEAHTDAPLPVITRAHSHYLKLRPGLHESGPPPATHTGTVLAQLIAVRR